MEPHESPESSATQGEPAPIPLSIERQYIKSIAYHGPAEPLGPSTPAPGSVEGRVSVESRSLDESQHEVIVLIDVIVGEPDAPLFTCALQYAAQVRVKGLSPNDLPLVLETNVAGLVYPYARSLVTTLTAESGWPPVLLQPVNFDKLYVQKHGVDSKP